MKSINWFFVYGLKKLEIGSSIAIRLTKLTGKSKVAIHPKHIINVSPWYLNFLEKGDVLLDLGSGNGQNALKVASRVNKVIGLEVDRSLISVARLTAKQQKKKNIHFYRANLEKKLKIKSNYVDKVLFLDVLEHLNNRDLILKEIKRVLKRGGLVFIGVPNKNTKWKKTQEKVGICSFSDPDHKVEFSEDDIKLLLKKHDFKIMQFGYSRADTPLRGLYDIIGGFSLRFYKLTLDLREKKVLIDPNEAGGFEIVAKI